VGLFYSLAEVEVGIGGGADVAMAQHLLETAKVRPAFEQMSGKGMTEHVWVNFTESRLFSVITDNRPHPLPAERPSPPGEEKFRHLSSGIGPGSNLFRVLLEPFHGGSAQGHNSLFIPFPGYV